MSKRLNIEFVIKVLSQKRVKFDRSNNVLDISKAEDLGSKSWGYIDFLSKQEFVLVGKFDYLKQFNKKEKSSKISVVKESIPVKKEAKWHSYSDIKQFYDYKGNTFASSEFRHLETINHLQDKFNRDVFKKTEEEKLKLFEIKDKIKNNINARPFYNEKIWSSEYETVEQSPTNK